MPDQTDTRYVVSSSPHMHAGTSVHGIMRDVIIAMLPALAFAIFFFGVAAIKLVVTCVVACVVTEVLCRKAMRRDAGVWDLSAVVTGMLLAFNLPPSLPLWQAAVGSVVAIAIAKQVFGGVGYNPFNPALIGRAFLLVSCLGQMTTWHKAGLPTRWQWNGLADAVTTATPLGMVKEAAKAGEALPFSMDGRMTWQFFVGDMGGCIGEVSALALLIGGAYLLYRRCITWHIPVAYIGTVGVFATILWLMHPQTTMPPQFHLLSGGLMLGALFMATDMVTSPITRKGQLIFGVGCGVLTMIIRTVVSGAYPEGVSFAILLMNATTPLINRATAPRMFGQRKKEKSA
jgi:electron transport complex protein RnfD